MKHYTITPQGILYRLLSPYEAREILASCQLVRTQIFAIRTDGQTEKLQLHADVDILRQEDPKCQFGLEVAPLQDILASIPPQ